MVPKRTSSVRQTDHDVVDYDSESGDIVHVNEFTGELMQAMRRGLVFPPALSISIVAKVCLARNFVLHSLSLPFLSFPFLSLPFPSPLTFTTTGSTTSTPCVAVLKTLGKGSFATVKLVKRDKGQPYSAEVGNKEGLYAAKVINKTVLKRMRTMTREGRKMTVHTAYEKVDEEISVMKKLR